MPNSVDELIQQDFVPWGNHNGLQFVAHYEIPEIARIDNWYDDQLFKVAQPQKEIRAIGTEWKKNNGDPFFLLIRLNASQMNGMLTWSYFCSSLESQRDFVNRSNAINDAIMSGWRERNNASDIAHERFVDAVTERTNTVNTATGTYQKVESGYNQYWMNSDGKYISTNSHTYNPNLDESLNHQKWDKLKEIKK